MVEPQSAPEQKPLTRDEIVVRFYKALAWSERDRTVFHVTELSRECMRQSWYAHVHGGLGYFNVETLLRFGIGTGIHKIPILAQSELPLSWAGIHGTIDEYENGVILEKKHTSAKFPRSPQDHYVRQVEYYKVLLLKNDFKVTAAYILYINVDDPEIRVFPLSMRPTDEIENEMLFRKALLEDHIKKKIPPPRTMGWQCGYCNYASICFGREYPIFMDPPEAEKLPDQRA